MKVRDVMTVEPITVRPDSSFKEVVDLLVEHRVGGLPVVDDQGKLVGIITETDMITKPAYGNERRGALSVVGALLVGGHPSWLKKAGGLQASEVMTRHVFTVEPHDDVQVAARRLLQRQVGRLPVVEEGRLVGIVARSDLLRPFHRSDEEIAADVRGVLDRWLETEGNFLTSGVDEGVVTLHGTVRFPSDVEVVEMMVGGLPGVVRVDHDLNVVVPDSRPEPRSGPTYPPTPPGV